MSDTAAQSEVKNTVVYSARVRVEARPGGVKLIHLPPEAEAVPMGMHGPIAKHYKISEGTYTPHASTLDYVIGATAGCLMGTLTRALQVRQIATEGGRLRGEAIGEIEAEDGVLVIRRIRMLVRLEAEESQRGAAERTIEHYASRCPVHRSLHNAIDISTELDFRPISA
jgi:uncharacterized OsmC-like protein